MKKAREYIYLYSIIPSVQKGGREEDIHINANIYIKYHLKASKEIVSIDWLPGVGLGGRVGSPLVTLYPFIPFECGTM